MDMSSAYVAGLIDGEGCVHLDTPKRTYRARVSIGMTEPALPLLRELHERYGGTLRLHRKATDRWAAAWMLALTGDPAAALLREIRPYLRLKGAQADLALAVEAVRASLETSHWGQTWTPEARARCEELKQQMHALNKKGPRAPAPSVEAA